MTLNIKNINFNWYQYINDNHRYRITINRGIKQALNNLENQNNTNDVLNAWQMADVICTLNCIDLLNEIQFGLVDYIAYKQIYQPYLDSNQLYDYYLSRILKTLYKLYPDSCQLPKYPNQLEIQNLSILHSNNHSDNQLPQNIFTTNYQPKISFNIILSYLGQDQLYYSQTRNLIEQQNQNMEQNIHKAIYDPHPTPSKQQLKIAIKDFKKHRNGNYAELKNYQRYLIQLRLIYKYQKQLKTTLWHWYLKHAIYQPDPVFKKYLKKHYHIIG